MPPHDHLGDLLQGKLPAQAADLTTLGDLPGPGTYLRVFEECPDIAEVVVVTREDLLVDFALYKQEIDLLKTPALWSSRRPAGAERPGPLQHGQH